MFWANWKQKFRTRKFHSRTASSPFVQISAVQLKNSCKSLILALKLAFTVNGILGGMLDLVWLLNYETWISVWNVPSGNKGPPFQMFHLLLKIFHWNNFCYHGKQPLLPSVTKQQILMSKWGHTCGQVSFWSHRFQNDKEIQLFNLIDFYLDLMV